MKDWGMEISVTVGKCNYCHKQAVLIDDYGSCPSNCPGNISQCKEYKCFVSDGVLERMGLERVKVINLG